MYDEIVAQISEYQLENDIDMLGVRNDTNELLSAMDLFIFPSLYEGMPIALVEAQTAGLPCVVSDVITDDVVITSGVNKLPLDDMQKWVESMAGFAEADSSADRDFKKEHIKELTKEKGFCVKDLGKRYEEFIRSKFENR